ncbi:MAG: glycosyltransferase [Candidatus Gastranaerophilales bacterium]|nr:glycosyltransferase [Candidatus Gastranaerophilales bacterium]
MAKVSIIIPIYNAQKYLKECVDSVINQTLKDIEIICVNDGSKDNSLEILKEYEKQDNRVIIIDKQNGGYASAINAGLEKATSEYIGIVESDDVCAKEMFEELCKKIEQTNADYVASDFYFLTEANTYRKSSNMVKPELDEHDCFNLLSSPKTLYSPAYPWKNLYKKSFLDENNIRMKQDGMGAYEDQPWNAEILSKAKKIAYLDKHLYFYRIDATDSSTNNGKIGLINYIKRRNQAREILIENNCFNDEIKEYFHLSAFGGSKLFFRKIQRKFKPQYYKDMQKLFALALEDNIEFKYFSKAKLKDFKNIQNYGYHMYILNNKIQKISKTIFSIGNSKDKKHKVLTILGIKLKFRRKNA